VIRLEIFEKSKTDEPVKCVPEILADVSVDNFGRMHCTEKFST